MNDDRGRAARRHGARTASRGAAQDEIVQGIKSFALYGFPESHAASFALLAYASAYLKAYHHAAFTCRAAQRLADGLLSPGDAGQRRRPPRRRGAAHRRHALGVALRRRGRRARAAARPPLRLGPARGDRHARIEAARAAAPLASLADFAARAQANERELATLAEVGALAALGGTRRQALWQVDALGRVGRAVRGVSADGAARRRRRCPR